MFAVLRKLCCRSKRVVEPLDFTLIPKGRGRRKTVVARIAPQHLINELGTLLTARQHQIDTYFKAELSTPDIRKSVKIKLDKPLVIRLPGLLLDDDLKRIQEGLATRGYPNLIMTYHSDIKVTIFTLPLPPIEDDVTVVNLHDVDYSFDLETIS